MDSTSARVLHVIDSLHPGGAQEVVMNLATTGSGKFGHAVATMHGRGVYWDRMTALGIPLHSLSPHKFFPAYIPRLVTLLGRERFDIVHCHLLAANIIAKPLAALCGVPVIINHDHTNDASRNANFPRLMLDTWSNRLATHLIAVSRSCREFLIHSEGVAPERITLVQNAIDLGRFSPGAVDRAAARGLLGVPENVPLVAGIGRLNPQKNFSLFLRVAAAIRRARPDVRFLIAGNGPEEQSLRGEADALGLRDAVVFSGYLADVRHVYLAADVLLMPSRFEGLPMTLLEAMAMEVPVVASNVDGMAEVLADGEDGFLVPSDAEEGFVRRTLTLLADRDLGRRLGGNARKKVEAQFSAGRMTAQVEAVYERFLP